MIIDAGKVDEGEMKAGAKCGGIPFLRCELNVGVDRAGFTWVKHYRPEVNKQHLLKVCMRPPPTRHLRPH